MSEWVDEWMDRENSKYEALSTKYYSLLIKNNGAHTPFAVCDSRQGGTGPELMQTHQLFKPIGQNGKFITAKSARQASHLPEQHSP